MSPERVTRIRIASGVIVVAALAACIYVFMTRSNDVSAAIGFGGTQGASIFGQDDQLLSSRVYRQQDLRKCVFGPVFSLGRHQFRFDPRVITQIAAESDKPMPGCSAQPIPVDHMHLYFAPRLQFKGEHARLAPLQARLEVMSEQRSAEVKQRHLTYQAWGRPCEGQRKTIRLSDGFTFTPRPQPDSSCDDPAPQANRPPDRQLDRQPDHQLEQQAGMYMQGWQVHTPPLSTIPEKRHEAYRWICGPVPASGAQDITRKCRMSSYTLKDGLTTSYVVDGSGPDHREAWIEMDQWYQAMLDRAERAAQATAAALSATPTP
ncbi:MAG: hypothetical protein Alpg2KO_28030 [Alphaproteobacteria bacterium]